MAFLRSSIGPDSAQAVRGRGVLLRAPTMSDYDPWAELRPRSREQLTTWEPNWQRPELSRGARRRLVRHHPPQARGD